MTYELVKSYSVTTDTWSTLSRTSSTAFNASAVDMVCAASSTSPGRLFVYDSDGSGAGKKFRIRRYELTDTDPPTDGVWTTDSPLTTVSSFLGDRLLVPAIKDTNPGCGLASCAGSGGDDDVFARFWDTSDLYPYNLVIMRWRSGIGWEEVSGFDVTSGAVETTHSQIFGNIGGTLYYGYAFGTDKQYIWAYTSNTTTTSCWTNTVFPACDLKLYPPPFDGASGFIKVGGMALTTGTSSALYLPIMNGDGSTPVITDYRLEEMKYSASGGGGSSCVITAATSGDIYNIGGISSDSTIHIVFTMWDNYAYGRSK